MSDRPVTIFTLGGTIAMAPGEDGGVVPALDAEALCAVVPELAQVAAVTTENFRELPGAHLTLDDVLALARAIEAARDGGAVGAVVTQGTDTMEETAFVLDTVLDPEFPVTVTGAMRHPGQPGADGPANLLAATAVAASAEAAGIGTVVVMNDEIHAGALVQKTHATRPSAFSSPGSGPMGFVSEGTPRIVAMPRARARLALAEISGLPTRNDASVALITIGLGDDGSLAQLAGQGGYDGIIVNAMGAGHVPEAVAYALAEIAGRLPVVLASRTGGGAVLAGTYGFKGSESDLTARGLIRAGWLPGIKARLLLMLCLRAGLDQSAIHRAFAGCAGGWRKEYS
jgi:L-asparaginase